MFYVAWNWCLWVFFLHSHSSMEYFVFIPSLYLLKCHGSFLCWFSFFFVCLFLFHNKICRILIGSWGKWTFLKTIPINLSAKLAQTTTKKINKLIQWIKKNHKAWKKIMFVMRDFRLFPPLNFADLFTQRVSVCFILSFFVCL